MTYLLGIDGGGTGCRAALADMSGQVLGTGKSGSANIMTDMNTARLNILDATEAALADARIDHSVIPPYRQFLVLPVQMSGAMPPSFKPCCLSGIPWFILTASSHFRVHSVTMMERW